MSETYDVYFTGHDTSTAIWRIDNRGPGGAFHKYHITTPIGVPMDKDVKDLLEINFQTGGIQEVGVNGVTNEALLAVVIDRLQCFNDGPFPSRENAIALTKCQEALMWLQKRTQDRQKRGVEGKQVE